MATTAEQASAHFEDHVVRHRSEVTLTGDQHLAAITSERHEVILREHVVARLDADHHAHLLGMRQVEAAGSLDW